jgi:uncharacterized membrane protein
MPIFARPRVLALALIIGGMLGLVAAIALTLEKFAVLEHPNQQLSCNISVLVGCGASLGSAQGAIFGAPNPVLGLMFWPVVVTVGVLALAVELPGWAWLASGVAATGAFVLVVWFIVQSIYVLGVLCPWCMLTWAVTIPLFLLVVGHCLRIGVIPVPPRLRWLGAWIYRWTPALSMFALAVVAVLAQVRLDVLHSL